MSIKTTNYSKHLAELNLGQKMHQAAQFVQISQSSPLHPPHAFYVCRYVVLTAHFPHKVFFSLSLSKYPPHPLFLFFFLFSLSLSLLLLLSFWSLSYLYLVILWFFACKGWNVSHLIDLILHQFPARFSQCKEGGKPFSHLNKLHCQLIFLQPLNDIFCTQVTGDSVTFRQFLSEGKDVKKMILV